MGRAVVGMFQHDLQSSGGSGPDRGAASRSQHAMSVNVAPDRKRISGADGGDDYRAMFELAGAGNAQSDPVTGRFLRVNRKLCEITGYSEQELLQKTVAQITHPDDRTADAECVQRMLQGDIKEYTL